MGLGIRTIIFLSIAGAGTLTGIAVAARNDYNGEQLLKKTKSCIVNLSKATSKILPSSKGKSIEEKVDKEKKNIKQINVDLEDSEIVVANIIKNENQNEEERIYKLPPINQTFQNTSFSSYLYFINESLDNLKLRKTLEELLKTYEILSGRLIRNKKNELLEVKLNNKGVFFSIVKYADTMSNVLPEIKEPSIAPNCTNLYGQNYSIEQCIKTSLPMVQIRITHFSDEKTCISIRTPNFLTDITSITKFIQDWSLLYRDESLTSTPIFDAQWISNYISESNMNNARQLDNYQPLALTNVGFMDWIKLAFKTLWEWIVGGGFQTRAFYISEKQLEELRYQVISDVKLEKENSKCETEGNDSNQQTPTTSSNTNTQEATTDAQNNSHDATEGEQNNTVEWISTKDVLIAHIWKKISTLPRNISYSNRVFKNCNLRLFIDKDIKNVFGNMIVPAVTPLTYITLLSSLYFISKRIHTSMSNLPIQLPNLLNWINNQKEEELPLIKVPVNLVGKQTDILFDDADVDTTQITFSKTEGKGDILWLYQESKPSIPNIVTLVKTSKITESENIKGYYVYITLSRIDMNSLIKQGGL